MKRSLIYFGLLFLALILQLVISPFSFVYDIKPDLLLIIVVGAGLLRGSRFGIGVGFVAGILQDLFLGAMLGKFTIVKMIIGGLAGLLEGKLFKENYLFSPLIIFFLTFIHETLTLLLSEKFLFNFNFIMIFRHDILSEAIINSLLGLVIYYILYRLDNPGGSTYE